MASTADTRLRRVEIAVETRDGIEFWLADLAPQRLQSSAVLELDEGSYKIVGFGASGIAGAETRVLCRPLDSGG